MSSKLIQGGAAKDAKPFQWQRVHSPASIGQMEPVADPAQLAQLNARVQELESLLKLKEQQAYQAGMQAGAARVNEQHAASLEEAVNRLGKTVQELAGFKSKLRREAEEDLLRLSIAIARRVLHRELRIDEEGLLGVIKAALQRIDGRELQRLRLHPEDATALGDKLEAICNRKVEIEADRTLSRGSAIFETTRGDLDASVDTQLSEIERGLIETARRHG